MYTTIECVNVWSPLLQVWEESAAGTALTLQKQFYSTGYNSGDRSDCKILFKHINIHESKPSPLLTLLEVGGSLTVFILRRN